MADLGLATFRNQITGTYCGTPWYMAPEIRENKIYDSKVDMYSFGLMMWEMWFGEIVRPEPISCSQDEVTRQINERKQRAEGRGDTRHPPPTKWIELMVCLWNGEPCARKTATESKELMKKVKQPVNEEKRSLTYQSILVNIRFFMFTLPVVTTIFSKFLIRYSLRSNAVTLTRDVPDRFDRFLGRIGQEELVAFLKMKFCCL